MITAVPCCADPLSSTVRVYTRPLPGPRPVGIRHYHTVIPDRIDTQTNHPRQFMVSAFYPAQRRSDAVCGMFLDLFAPSVQGALACVTEGIDADTKAKMLALLYSIGLRSHRNAIPEAGGHLFPVLIYYPAGGSNRFGNVDVCEGLASHGFVVLALDSPHDSDVAVFPDGSLSKGPLKGDYITPGVEDVAFLLGESGAINADLAGIMDLEHIGIFGHSRGGYISNICAFQNDRIGAAVSIDSFLWGYAGNGAGLDKHSREFQQRVRSTAKPLLRFCGRPEGSDPQDEARFCLDRDGKDFIGPFYVLAFPGWEHNSFRTTPWLCGSGEKLLANQPGDIKPRGDILTGLLAGFFNVTLCGAELQTFVDHVEGLPALGLAYKNTPSES